MRVALAAILALAVSGCISVRFDDAGNLDSVTV